MVVQTCGPQLLDLLVISGCARGRPRRTAWPNRAGRWRFREG